MKRGILFILMIGLLCACAPSEKQKEEFCQWRQTLNTVSVTAEVSICQKEQAGTYTLQCAWTPEESYVEVLSPEAIAGVAASRTSKNTQLEYDGLMLSLGDLSGITPVNAIPELLDRICSGYIELCYTEDADGSITAVQFAEEQGITLRLWLDSNMCPIRADFTQDKNAEITISITKWNIE